MTAGSLCKPHAPCISHRHAQIRRRLSLLTSASTVKVTCNPLGNLTLDKISASLHHQYVNPLVPIRCFLIFGRRIFMGTNCTVLYCTACSTRSGIGGGPGWWLFTSRSTYAKAPLWFRHHDLLLYSSTHFLLTSPCLPCRSSTRRTVLQSFCTVLHHFVSFYHISSLYCVVCPCEIHHADAKVPLATLRDRAYSTVCTRP
jgi:hypothetical protein